MNSDQPYVPDEETVREQYNREQPPHIGTVTEKRAEFDRFIESVKRAAKAEALREAAGAPVPRDVLTNGLRSWLRARADQIEKETPDDPHP